MSHKLSVTVQVDLEGTYCRLVVAGCLTETNQQALRPLVRRARALPIGGHVVVDLASARLVDTAALDLLRCGIDDDGVAHRTEPVQFLLPEPPPVGITFRPAVPEAERARPGGAESAGADRVAAGAGSAR